VHRYGNAVGQWLGRKLLIASIIVSLVPCASAAAAPLHPSRPRPGAPCLPYPMGQAQRPQALAATVLLVPAIPTPLLWPVIALISVTLPSANDQSCVLAPDHR
jgi:hypothetical protein